MAEQNDRQVWMVASDAFVNGLDVAQNEVRRLAAPAESAQRRVWSLSVAMAAMIMGIDMETAGCQRQRKPKVAGGMFGQTVVDLYDANPRRFGWLIPQRELCSRWRSHVMVIGETHRASVAASARSLPFVCAKNTFAEQLGNRLLAKAGATLFDACQQQASYRGH
jgi:hypothetical protein